MTDFLDEKRREITDRLNELGPLVEEYQPPGGRRFGAGRNRRLDRRRHRQLHAVVAAGTPARLGRQKSSAARRRPKNGVAPRDAKKWDARKQKSGTPAGSTNKAAPAGQHGSAATATARPLQPRRAKRRAGRRKGSGTRAAQALSFVQGQPGITIPELAAKMGIKQNYLYRVLPGLEQEGKIEKKGRGWHPKG